MEQTKPTAFMVIEEIHGVFVDAVLTDEADNLVFISLWGHDTAIREMQGRLTLGLSEGGVSTFHVVSEDRRVFVRIGSIEAVQQMTGRVHTDILGELVHLWLYQQEIVKPDLANHRAMLISKDGAPDNLWRAVMQVSPVPLLEHWEERLLPLMRGIGMVKQLEGVNQTGFKIVINESEMALLVKQECCDGHLALKEQ